MKMKKGLQAGIFGAGAGAVGTCAAVMGGCRWLFHYAIARKQWGLPGFITRRIEGNGEPDAYDEEVAKAEEELRKLPYEPIALISQDGKKLVGRFYQGEEGNRDVFLAVHGCRSRGTKEFCFLHNYYRKAGVSFLLIDLRACGDSEGDYMTYGVKESEDLMLWLSWLLGRCGADCRIFMHGVSMGAATVLMTAGKKLPEQVAGVIGDCSYTSAWDEFSYQLKTSFHLPEKPVLALTNRITKKEADFDMRKASPKEAGRRSEIPHLFIHGDKDDFVPFHMMDELYEACTAPKKKVVVEGAVHARAYHTNVELYEKSLDWFRNEFVKK